ncbi:MAG TPA: DUF4097 family beta strand repeat-containing protein [Candidatus Acidoferrales bacterium]|nr:DUF4097 family beta strand repeat-containing protein [Candidatus Acidoferrales bacterium]
MTSRLTKIRFVFVPLIAISAFLAGCTDWQSYPGSFDRTLSVSGPVRVELENGSGDVHLSQGSDSQVVIHCQFHVHVWPGQDPHSRIADVSAHPPVAQDSGLIRIGNDVQHWSDVEFDYTIQVPHATEVHLVNGSGDMVISGIQGPATLTTGSGDITADRIGNDTIVKTGSGTVELSDIAGEVEATAGSGDITLNHVQRAARVHTGSGNITVDNPGESASIVAGSGDIQVSNPSGDLRVHTGSGEIDINGSPSASAFWEIQSGSGDVTLDVSSSSNFRFYAHSSDGSIDTSIPINITEKTSSRELRGTVGSGQARVEVETSSGDIRIR